MPDFKAPNAPNSILAPTGGAYSAPPDPLAGFKEPTSKGREGREEKGEEGMREGGGMGGKEKEGRGRGMGWEWKEGWEKKGREGEGRKGRLLTVMKISYFRPCSISQTVIGRWAHAARQFVSIEFSFHSYNV